MTVRRVLGVTTKSRLLPFVRYSSISYAFIVFALCELHDRVTSLCFFPSLSLSFFFFVRIKLEFFQALGQEKRVYLILIT